MSVRAAGLVCLLLLFACGEPATVPADVSDSFPQSTTSTETTAVPFSTSPTSTGTTATSTGSETTPDPTLQDRSQTGLEGAPAWFDLEDTVTILEGSEEIFELTDVSTYRFRSALTTLIEGEELSVQVLGEVTEDPAAFHWIVTGPLLEDGSRAHEFEVIMIEGQAWMTEGFGIWEELSEVPSQFPFFPPMSYQVAASGAASALKQADTLRESTLSVVGEEEVIGLDVLHLRFHSVDSTTDTQGDIWITPTGLLVALHLLGEDLDSGESGELTWDIYDLDADIEIQPPAP
jgi:hypothetical protein